MCGRQRRRGKRRLRILSAGCAQTPWEDGSMIAEYGEGEGRFRRGCVDEANDSNLNLHALPRVCRAVGARQLTQMGRRWDRDGRRHGCSSARFKYF